MFFQRPFEKTDGSIIKQVSSEKANALLQISGHWHPPFLGKVFPPRTHPFQAFLNVLLDFAGKEKRQFE